MQFTAASISAILALTRVVPALAQTVSTMCDGDTEPDWAACDTVATYLYDNSATVLGGAQNECYTLPVPDGTDSTTLNCELTLCFINATGVTGSAAYTDYGTLRAVCDGDAPSPSGGTLTDTNYGITISASLNPDYNPPSKRDIKPKERAHARNWQTLGRRQGGTCVDGSGTLQLFATYDNSERADDMIAVTGRLPAGSMYTIQDSDSQTIGVSTSVSVEAGFFDLFSASASVTVDGSETEMSTVGVNVNVDCDSGQEGIIYLVPTFTFYQTICTSNSQTEIDVYVPIQDQNDYIVQCLGQGS